MDLMNMLMTSFSSMSKKCVIILLAFMLAACAAGGTTPVKPEQPQQAVEPEVIEAEPQAAVETKPLVEEPAAAAEVVEPELPQKQLNAELMYYILTAEIAGQRGEMGIAVDLYAKAAAIIDSVSLAERSAQVAAYTRDQKRINRALKRWIEVDPNNADVYIMQAPLLMLQGDYDAMLASVNKALQLEPTKAKDYLERITDGLRSARDKQKAADFVEQLDSYKKAGLEAIYANARMAMFAQNYAKALTEVDRVLVIGQLSCRAFWLEKIGS
jgi:tetratricopeptide (TPR) repeat protein